MKCLEVEAQKHCLSDVVAASLNGKYKLEGRKFIVMEFGNEVLQHGRLLDQIEDLFSQLERETLIRRLQHIYMNR